MQEQPTRHDFVFMARMLGLRPGVDYEPSGVILSDKPSLGNAVLFGTFDPIANARAQQRIGELLVQCEQVERSAHDAAEYHNAASLIERERDRWLARGGRMDSSN